MDRQQIETLILQAVDKSQTLDRREKRRIERVMKSPFRRRAREKIVDDVTAAMLAEEVLVVTPEGVEMAIDLDGIIAFIERILPLIMQLITLFGG